MEREPISDESRVFRFKGIEGLRGWLAGIVMLAHITFATGMSTRHHLYKILGLLSDYAVMLFIMISGFVITHLLLSKPEPYFPYIAKRFLRIYPVYIVCLAVGIPALYLSFDTFLAQPWGALTPSTDRVAADLQSLSGQFLPHLLAHLTMLHGAISNKILYDSEYMFLSPAWSLSLEWQFYLVAPFIIYAIKRSQTTRLLLAVFTVVAYAAYWKGAFGSFFRPSILPGQALYFATGIFTRLIIYRLPRGIVFPIGLAIVALLLLSVSMGFLPFYAWAVFIGWMISGDNNTGAARTFVNSLSVVFDSKVARYMGDISYPLYLIHVPIIQLVLFLCVTRFHLGMMKSFWTTLITVPIVTVLASSVMHRYLEKPFVRYGKSLFCVKPPACLSSSR
jgi:peptidoglycan/LPS O-acetylase OafA/YrhL